MNHVITHDQRVYLNMRRMVAEYIRESQPIVRQMGRIWDISVRSMKFSDDGIEYIWHDATAKEAFEGLEKLLHELKRVIQKSYIRSGLLPDGEYWTDQQEPINLALHPSISV